MRFVKSAGGRYIAAESRAVHRRFRNRRKCRRGIQRHDRRARDRRSIRGEDDHLAATRKAVIAAALPHVALRRLDRPHAGAGGGGRGRRPRPLPPRLPARRRRPRARLPPRARRRARRRSRVRRPPRPALPRPGRLRGDAPARARPGRPRGGPPRRRPLRPAAPRRRRGAGDLAHRRHHLDRPRRREPRLQLVLQARHPLGGLVRRAPLLARRRRPPTPRPPASSSAAASTT